MADQTIASQPKQSSTTLKGAWLWLARLAWALVLAGNLMLVYYLLPRSPYSVFLNTQFKDAFRAVQGVVSLNAFGWYMLAIYYLVLLSFLVFGLFIAWRKPSDWMALFTSATLISLGVLFSKINVVDSRFNTLPGYDWLVSLDSTLLTVSLLGLIGLIYLFPDGRLLPQRLGWGIAAVLTILVAVALSPYSQTSGWQVTILGMIMLLVGGLLSQFYRYRRASTALQRQQTKWAVFGLMAFPLSLFSFGLLSSILPLNQHPVLNLLGLHGITLAMMLIPLTLGISILRYRLWDIDVIVRRTLIYGALTATLALVFFSSIVLFQGVFTAVSGQNSAVSVVISTLLIAALFTPLRRRIQRDIDRRFFRQKYNAEQAIGRFAAAARQETDPDQLCAELLAVVAETMQPEHVHLWLIPVTARKQLNEKT